MENNATLPISRAWRYLLCLCGLAAFVAFCLFLDFALKYGGQLF